MSTLLYSNFYLVQRIIAGQGHWYVLRILMHNGLATLTEINTVNIICQVAKHGARQLCQMNKR